jgi:hypothetical protein
VNVSGISHERLAQMRFIHVDEALRAYVNEDGIRTIAENDAIVNRLRAARDQAHHDAVKNLARCKFANFGTLAARWLLLTKILGDRLPNPFWQVVMTAKALLVNGGRQ